MFLPIIQPDVLSPLGQVQIHHTFQRVWREHLTSVERDVLSYLLDNSVAWRRTTFKATLDQMVNGVPGKIPKVGLSRRTLHRALQALIQRGLVGFENTPGCYTYEINLNWEPHMTAIRPTLATPKRLQNVQPLHDSDNSDVFTGNVVSLHAARSAKSAIEECQSDHGSVPNWPLLLKKDSTEDLKKESPASEVSASEVIAVLPGLTPPVVSLTSKSTLQHVQTELPLAPKIRIRTRPVPVTAAQAVENIGVAAEKKLKDSRVTNDLTWRIAYSEVFPDTTVKPFTNQERCLLASARKRLEGPSFQWFDFLDWSIREWRFVIANKFSWMTRRPPPAFPEVGFMCCNAFLPQFLDAYAGRREKEHLDSLVGEKGLYNRLRAQGMAHDVALVEVGKSRAFGEHGDKLSAEREQLARTARALDAERKALAGNRSPIRPRAPSPPTKPIDHAGNPYENPEARPDLTAMLDTLANMPSWENLNGA